MREYLEKIRESGLWRSLNRAELRGEKIKVCGREMLNFASNDYLGMSSRLDFQREFFEGLKAGGEYLMGSTSSRLICGNFGAYCDAENIISGEYGRPCLIFNGGYHANTGILPAVAGEGDFIACDRLAHASIIDALSLGRAKWARFAHNDYGHLRKILSQNRAKYRRVFIATESVFSMDGDKADLRGLAQIKKEFDCLLYVDEAHGFGVFGGRGLGLCEEQGVLGDADIIMCTLGKALGGQGAFAVCSPDIRDILINRVRPFIFTTALPPISLYWTIFAFKKILSMSAEREKLKKLSKSLRGGVKGAECLGDSQIVPVMVGDSQKALRLSEMLAEAGIFAPAIRYPTVPANGARVRLSASAAMGLDSVKLCAEAITNSLCRL